MSKTCPCNCHDGRQELYQQGGHCQTCFQPTWKDTLQPVLDTLNPRDMLAGTAALSPPDHSQTSTKVPMPSEPKEAKPAIEPLHQEFVDHQSRYDPQETASKLNEVIDYINGEATALSDHKWQDTIFKKDGTIVEHFTREIPKSDDLVEYTCPECGSVKLLPKEQVQQWKEEITYED